MSIFARSCLVISLLWIPGLIKAAEMIGSFIRHELPVSAIHQLSRRGAGAPTALSADVSGAVIYWDVTKNSVIWQLPAPTPFSTQLTNLAISPMGELFSVLRSKTELVIRDTTTGKLKCQLQVPEAERHEVWMTGAFSKTQRVFAVSSRSGLVSFFDTGNGQHIRTVRDFMFPSREEGGVIIGFTPDEQLLTVVGKDVAGVVSWSNGSILKKIPLRDFGVITQGIFSNDLRIFALASEKSYFLIDTQKLTVLHSVKKPMEGYAHGIFTANMQFDDASRSLHIWNLSLESPWPGVYEEIDVVAGNKKQSIAVREPIFSPDPSLGYFFVLSTLIPGSGLLLSGGQDPNAVYIWKL